MNTPSRILLASLLILLSACNGRLGSGRSTVPRYEVHVDALQDAAAPAHRSYVLVAGVPGVEPLDLQFREYADQVHRVLASRGYVPATDPRQAELAVFVSYGLGTPDISYESAKHPAYALAPQAQAQPDPAPPPALPVAADSGAPVTPTNASGGTPTNAGPTSAPPAATPVATPAAVAAPVSQPAPIRLRTGGYRGVTHARFLRLSAIDAAGYRSGGALRELWRVTATSHGETEDLRVVLPVLAAAVRNAIGTNPGRAQALTIRDDDPRVDYVRGRAR